MKVHFRGAAYDCIRAARDGNRAVLYLTGGEPLRFSGVSIWEVFSLEGGDWSPPEVIPEEQLRADVDFITVMTGGEFVSAFKLEKQYCPRLWNEVQIRALEAAGKLAEEEVAALLYPDVTNV